MDDVAGRLLREMCDGFVPYVSERIAALGGDPDLLQEATDEGAAWLTSELEALLGTDPTAQSRTPFEVFRSALAPVTRALSAAGVPEPERDPAQQEVAPDDPYDLFPASPREVSEEAWMASIAWGVDKAARMSRPQAVAVTTNLMDAAALEAAANRGGYGFEVVGAADAASGTPLVAFVDLETTGADDAIVSLVAAGIRVVAYGPHVDSFAMVRARTLGASIAEPRSRVFKDPGAYLSPVV